MKEKSEAKQNTRLKQSLRKRVNKNKACHRQHHALSILGTQTASSSNFSSTIVPAEMAGQTTSVNYSNH